MNKKKIAILLPFKDHFTHNKAGSASIWVKDFNQKSKYKNEITILGNTDFTNDLIDKKKYINLKLKRNAFESKNRSYVKEFLKQNLISKYSLVEIHNRPSYVRQIIRSRIKIKIVLIFHNNPITLGGSKSTQERKFLLETCDKIIFVSNWVKERFFDNMDLKSSPKCLVIYPSVQEIKKMPNKENIISFVGKLNKSKGFNIFGSSVLKILKKYKNWRAIVIGDEPRESYNFKHERLDYKGWISHEKTLKIYNKTSISVVPSTWEEPFGRTSMEAASRGCATIVSKRGGLKETVNHAIFLNKISHDEVYEKLNFLIRNRNLRNKLQKKLFSNVLHKLSINNEKIDNYRDEILNKFTFSINKNKNLKILHVSNFGARLSNRLYFISIAKKLSNGFVRLGHDVTNISDRDIIKFNRNVANNTGVEYLNKLLYESVQNYNPDLILLGHTDNLKIETLDKIKNFNKNIKIAQWFEDNLALSGPDPLSNQKRLLQYEPYIDFNFITTDPGVLSFLSNKKNYFYLPIPVDHNIENLNIYDHNESVYDLFFTMSHGVNRGVLKPNKKDERDSFIYKLIQKNPNIIFDIYGYENRQPIWSQNFYNTIRLSKMGLNLSRTNSVKYYTSNRISSLVGNGLMTFVDRKTQLNDFFNSDEIIFYENINDLSTKLNYYKNNDKIRKKIAFNGQKKYFQLFNSETVSSYILNKIFDIKVIKKFKWMK
jgi:glycosyltransferase involved in cell wall biosynthesis